MFGLGFDELLVLAAVAAFFFQKKDVANLLRWFKTTRGKLANWQYELEDKIESLTQEAQKIIEVAPAVKTTTQQNEPSPRTTENAHSELDVNEISSEENVVLPSLSPLELQKQLRSEVRIKLKKLDHSLKEIQSNQLINRLKQNEMIRSAPTIAAFIPLADEVQIIALLQYFLEEGKILYLPKVKENFEMQWIRVQTLDDLAPGSFGILEPVDMLKSAQITYPAIDLFLVPGVVFGEKGERVGRGKGFYDRNLKNYPHSQKVGICFDFQVFDLVPQESHDVLMDYVVTPKRWISSRNLRLY